MLSSIGEALYKRAMNSGDNVPTYDVPGWAWIFVLVDLVLFLPLVVWVQYTVQGVYPIFAIVEDENPPPYEPLALSEDAAPDAHSAPILAGRSGAVSTSARSIHRLLMANGGLRANFRGLACYVVQFILTGLLFGLFYVTLGNISTPVATLLASLTLVQLSAAWVHIVITQPSERSFWSRLPPFNRTFNATWKPVLIYWAAVEVTRWSANLAGAIIGVRIPEHNTSPPEAGDIDSTSAWGILVILLVSLLLTIFIVIPAQVVLVRVQASLLPPDEDTIMFFDRSFGGQVEPLVASGKGYATVSQAWSTFSAAAWRRLVLLYAKVFLIGTIVTAFMVAVIVPELIIVIVNSKRSN